MGFGRACAPVRCTHPSFWAHCHPKRGAAPPPPSQLRCFSFNPHKYRKSIQLGPPTSKAFSLHWTTCRLQRLWNMRSLGPAHRSFADPSRNILGSKVCAGATIRPNFFGFSFFYIGFGSFLLLFSSFYFLLIHLFFILLFLSLLYHSSSSYSSLIFCLLYYRHEISVILRGYLRGSSLC